MNNCEKIISCLCCGNTDLKQTLDLGNQPLANSYCKSSNDIELEFPLAINFCQECSHVQLTHAVNPDLLFKNYLYVSGTTNTLKNYFKWFTEYTESYFTNKKLSVLDIACNDGTQLNFYKDNGHETFGIDPAENLYPISSVNHNIICDYFTKQSIEKLNGKKFDIIIAQNVLAHNSYPKHFIELIAELLDNNGKAFIQTSQANLIQLGQFDTIYHEHISFFSTKSFANLVSSTGLFLNKVIKTDIHGTSYIFVLSKNEEENNSSVYLYDNEVEKSRTIDSMLNFSSLAENTVTDLKEKIDYYRNKNFPIIGYGAAAKGNTVLNFSKIKLDYIVDDNPLKQNLFTPGMKIPIVSIDFINQIFKDQSVVWLPLSWNFFNEIRTTITNKRSLQDHFIQLNFTKL